MGALILVRGPNGSGKTTLLRRWAGLPELGGVDGVGRPAALPAPGGAVGWVPQAPRDGLVGLTVAGEFRLRGRPVPVASLALSDRPSATLSQGEARRVALAQLDGQGTWFLDEPFADLDAAAADALALRLAAHDGTVVVADHTGRLDGVADEVVSLGPAGLAPWPAVPAADGPVVITAGPAIVHGRRLPAVSLGPGLHAVTGPNGSGKTTLLRRLAGLTDADVQVHGARPRPGVDVALAFEEAQRLFTGATVADEVGGAAAAALVPATLLARHPLTLSRGEAQRVALAGTLDQDVPVVLLDEPEAHLDAGGRQALMHAVAARVADGACVIVATHDEGLAARAQTRVRLEGP